MSTSHWHTRVKHWNKVTPPLRPHADSIAKQIDLVGASSPRVLVLGVTPELTRGFDNVVAVDKEQVMIDSLWIGDSATKTAIHADWYTVELPPNSISGVVGDGSLNMVGFSQPVTTLVARLLDLMQPGARAAIRVFSRPEELVTEQQVRTSTDLPWHAFRCLLNMHIAGTEGTNIPSKRMLQKFNEMYPDREQLCAQAGYDLEEISLSMDAYVNSPTSTSYPTRSEWIASMPPEAENVELADAGSYPLAQHYPILSFTKAV